MPRRIQLESNLTDVELYDRYRMARDAMERCHRHFLWLVASGLTAIAVAAVTGYSSYWIGLQDQQATNQFLWVFSIDVGTATRFASKRAGCRTANLALSRKLVDLRDHDGHL